MSHFTHLKTRFKSLIHLEMALASLDIPFTYEEQTANNSDEKKQKNQPIHLRISPSQIKTLKIDPTSEVTKETPISFNTPDIFFKWNGEEYELILDRSFWDRPYSVEKFIRVLSDEYVAVVVCGETRKLGFTLVKAKVNVDGSHTVTFQRWNKAQKTLI